MKEYFDFVLKKYLFDNKLISKNNETFKVLTHYIPEELKKIIGLNFKIKGSMGQSYKSDCPWIAICNPKITTTTQSGIYIAYLFKKDMSGFYLTLNQGIKNYQDLFHNKKYDYAVKVANYFKNEISSSEFSKDDICLGNVKSGDRSYGYEKTTIVSKYYSLDSYNDEGMLNDLLSMVSIYNEIAKLFEKRDYNDLIKAVIADNQPTMVDGDSAIQKIKEFIESDSDISNDYQKQMIEQLPYIDKTDKFKLITSPKLCKIDYVKKTIRDMKIGLQGEALVVEYEKERLNSLGREDLEAKVKWVSKASDGYGYDIESFDIDENGHTVPIKIEVKTTSSQIDTDFYFSKNEVEASKKYKKKYCVYRIYDAKSLNPKFYKVFGEITDNFYLDPVTFKARYKYIKEI